MAVAVAVAVVVLGAALGGCSASPGGAADRGGTEASGASATPRATPSSSGAGAASGAVERGATGSFQNPDLGSGTGRSAAAPVRVSIPAIGVDSGLESLTRDDAGSIQPPVDFGSAGWYSQGVVPGNVGPAVVAGHIDSAVGPAVFYRLSELQPGDRVDVELSDGSTATFAVDREIEVAKADFPTAEVYGPTPTAQLRLVTCGGVFDDSYGHYLDNVVVFATRV